MASKGLADYLMLRRKLPDEIFTDRRTLPSGLCRDDVTSYLANLDRALDHTVTELGDEGSVDLFDLTRRLGHRMGLASWAGAGAAYGAAFERLVVAFDTLDGSDAFVHPDAMAAIAASGKRAERAALDDVVAVIDGILQQRDSLDGGSLFERIVDAWAEEPDDVRLRGIALDVALIHIASMSNLMAALGWALVDLIEHPDEARQVADCDRDLAQRCALESTRMAQRSIMSRAVLAPVTFDTGDPRPEGGQPRRDDATARPLRAHPGMGDAPAASTRADRRGGPRGGRLPGSLHTALSGQRPRRTSARLYSALCPYHRPTSCSPTASPWSPAVARASVMASPRGWPPSGRGSPSGNATRRRAHRPPRRSARSASRPTYATARRSTRHWPRRSPSSVPSRSW